MSHVFYGLLTTVLSQSEATPDPRPFSDGAHPPGHMDFAKEFLCSCTLGFIVLSTHMVLGSTPNIVKNVE